jgi:hypothetical protein
MVAFGGAPGRSSRPNGIPRCRTEKPFAAFGPHSRYDLVRGLGRRLHRARFFSRRRWFVAARYGFSAYGIWPDLQSCDPALYYRVATPRTVGFEVQIDVGTCVLADIGQSYLPIAPGRQASFPIRYSRHFVCRTWALAPWWLADDEKAPTKSRSCHYGDDLLGTLPKRTVRLNDARTSEACTRSQTTENSTACCFDWNWRHRDRATSIACCRLATNPPARVAMLARDISRAPGAIMDRVSLEDLLRGDAYLPPRVAASGSEIIAFAVRELAEIDIWARRNKVKSRSEAIRRLVEKGLKA